MSITADDGTKSADLWTQFINKCFQQRISDEFINLAKQVQKRELLPRSKICQLLLDTQEGYTIFDPLLVVYLQGLLSLRIVESYDVLTCILEQHRRQHASATDLDMLTGVVGSLVKFPVELEPAVLNCIAQHVASDYRPKSKLEARKIVEMCGQWMTALTSENADLMIQTASGSFVNHAHDVLAIRENLATLIIAVTENINIASVIDSKGLSRERKRFVSTLSAFINLLAATSMPLANRLNAIYKLKYPLQHDVNENLGTTEEHSLDLAHLKLQNVVDVEPINTRGGLLVFLDALLHGRPCYSDNVFLNYLQARHKGDIQSAIVDAITAAFDVLCLAVDRLNTSEELFISQSFLVNKVPNLISSLSPMAFEPINHAYLISQSLGRLHPSFFTSIPPGYGMTSKTTTISDARQQFVHACALHGLISRESIPHLVGGQVAQDAAMQARRSRRSLVNEFNANSHKLDTLIKGMESMDGNAVAATEAVVEIFQKMCSAADTMTLKGICNKLSKRSLCLDAIALHNSVTYFLQPLSQILDDWKREEDQGECKPVYDEFGACLFLWMTTVYRFKLSTSDLAITRPDSFLRKFHQEAMQGFEQSSLSLVQDQQLSGWIKALFDTGGIGDDLMSACSPETFYTILPSLINQTTMASKADVIDLETLKNGLELLLEPFLMPSLIPMINWLARNTRTQDADIDLILAILQKLLQPTSLHGDAIAMHKTVLSIVGRNVDDCLHELQATYPDKQDVISILQTVQPYRGFCIASGPSYAEMQSWAADGSTSVLASLKASTSTLCTWSSDTNVSVVLPTYSHRRLAAAVQSAGACQVVHALCDEIKTQTSIGCGDYALDVANSMILTSVLESHVPQSSIDDAPIPLREFVRHLNLREALQLQVNETVKLINEDAFKAETLIRLGRRVEAQAMNIPLSTATFLPITEDAMDDLQLPPNVDLTATQTDPLGFSADETGLGLHVDISAAQEGNMGGDDETMLVSATDDIFGGIDIDSTLDLDQYYS